EEHRHLEAAAMRAHQAIPANLKGAIVAQGGLSCRVRQRSPFLQFAPPRTGPLAGGLPQSLPAVFGGLLVRFAQVGQEGGGEASDVLR
ncbi:MAG: hypothetical protein ACUVTG_17030, partial [Candidatus Oleimicrobiaceae bacterium]